MKNKHVCAIEIERAGARALVKAGSRWHWWASTDVGVVMRIAIDTVVEERHLVLKELQDERIKRLISWR